MIEGEFKCILAAYNKDRDYVFCPLNNVCIDYALFVTGEYCIAQCQRKFTDKELEECHDRMKDEEEEQND